MKKLLLFGIVFLIGLYAVFSAPYLQDNSDNITIDGNTSDVANNTNMEDRGWRVVNGNAIWQTRQETGLMNKQHLHLDPITPNAYQIASTTLINGTNLTINFTFYGNDIKQGRMYLDGGASKSCGIEHKSDTSSNFGIFYNDVYTSTNVATRAAGPNNVSITIYNNGCNVTCNHIKCFNGSLAWNAIEEFKLASFDSGGYRLLQVDDIIVNNVSAPTPDVTAPTITFAYPKPSSVHGAYDGWLNITINEAGNCTTNITDWVYNGAKGNNTRFYFYNSGTLTDGNHSINASCWDTLGNNGSSVLSFIIDTVSPGLVSDLENNDTIINLINNLTGQINGSDNLKIWRMNVTTPEGYSHEVSNINTTTYVYNVSINTSSYGVGKHNLTVEICDAHTKNEIGFYDYEKTATKIKYKFTGYYISIEPENKNEFKSVNTKKEKDKYSIEFEKETEYQKTESTYIIKSNINIEIVGDDKYKGWLIIGNNWLDFENKGGHDVIVERINKKEVHVITKGLKFSSIGDLNCNNATYIYYAYNYTTKYAADELESANSEFKLSINITGTTIESSKVSANLYYNNTIYEMTKTTSTNYVNFTKVITLPLLAGSSEIKSFNFNYTIDNGSSEYNTTTFNQTIYKLIIDNCTDTTNTTLIINIYNEEAPSDPLIATVKTTMLFWYSNNSLFRNVSYEFAGNNTYSVCISPNWSIIYADIYLQYSTVGGFTHRYYIVNGTFTNVTQTINMYNFNTTTGISDLKGTIRIDKNYTYFPNVLAKLLRFYPGTDTWRTVQMDKSGDFGLVFFNIKEENTDYKIVFQDADKYTLKTTDSMKFVCTSGICELTFLLNEHVWGAGATDLRIGSTYNNNTEVITVSWDDPTGLTSAVRAWVIKESMSGYVTVCDTTVESSTGSINCDTSGYEGNLLLRVYSSASPETPILRTLIEKARLKLVDLGLINARSGALWTSGIVITIAFAGFFSMIGGLIMVVFGLLVVYFMGLMTITNISFIITVGVLSIIIGLKVRK